MSSKALGTFCGVGLCAISLAIAACGDDDPKPSADASVDAGSDSGGPGFIPRPDAGISENDPIRPCDIFNPDSCPSGQICDVLVRLFGGETEFTLYTGCVAETQERGIGDPCDPGFTGTTPYQTEGLRDLVFRDQCAAGLICTADPKIRGGTSCQPSCRSGRYQDGPAVMCEDSSSFCVAAGAYQEYCRPSDACDINGQTGCRPGLNCYLRPRDDGSGYLSVCFPPAEMLIPDGRPCETYNACRAGSSCNGPLNKAMADWDFEMDVRCRPSCSADGSVLPGGADGDAGTDDAGAGGAMCGSGTQCESFGDKGLNFTGIAKPPYGQCE
jgi:hypothetical protein